MLVDINLLPQKERDRPAFVIAALAVVLVAILLWAVLFFMAKTNDNERADLSAQSSEIATQQAAIREQLEASTGLNEEQQLQVTVDWAESYQFDLVPLLDELVANLPERGFFNNFSYIGPNSAVLTLQFDASREAAYYLTQLKASGLVASVTLDSVVNQELETLEEKEEEEEAETEEELIENPRYLATYSLVFVDDRIPAEGTAEAEAAEDAAEEPAEVTVEEEIEEEPEETIEETETVPEETEVESDE